MQMPVPRPNTDRIILHLDYDCFYASVIEVNNPQLRGKPLAVQQKQIIVTCNYLARRRGLRKLQLIAEAKSICPDIIIVLGEDLTQFRDASKELYQFIRTFSWNGRVERLGLDEVFLDATDVVDYNLALLNGNSLESSFFHLSQDDPTQGFSYDASVLSSYSFPESNVSQRIDDDDDAPLRLRLQLGSHFMHHIRKQIELIKGYTCTGGVATSKVLSKLVGNCHKPQSHTTLMPPYISRNGLFGNVTRFMDDHEVGKVPGIGFKMAVTLREYVLKRKVELKDWVLDLDDFVSVSTLRTLPGMNEAILERVLGGPTSPKGIGYIIWKIIHGADDAAVAIAQDAPKQISIEDSYTRLNTHGDAVKQMIKLSKSLLQRMRVDLTEQDKGTINLDDPESSSRHWITRPRTLRLSTRPRVSVRADENRPFGRISRSGPLPNFVFDLAEPVDCLAERLTSEHLIPMFRQLHPQKHGWDLSLINVAVTNMKEMAGAKAAVGRDISKMFKDQETNLKGFRIEEADNSAYKSIPKSSIQSCQQDHCSVEKDIAMKPSTIVSGSEDITSLSQQSRQSAEAHVWDSDDGFVEESKRCETCGAWMPAFAMAAHERFHREGE